MKTEKNNFGYCNKCGVALDEWDARGDYAMRRALGYGSRYDGKDVDIRLCCLCMDELIGACVRSPLVNHKIDWDRLYRMSDLPRHKKEDNS